MTPDEYTNQEFFLDVGDGHQLYVQDWGKKDAKTPIIFLHGGPGNGCADTKKLLFDPTRQRVIFHDQRGSGKSLPYGSLQHNTTQDLIDDIHTIMTKLQIKQCVLTGGSWGACLALAYAIAHPKEVATIVTQGIFTATAAERNWLTNGEFRSSFPDNWETYLQHTPPAHRKNPSAYHLKQILHGTDEDQKRSAYVYGTMEYSMLALDDRPRPTDYTDYDPAPTKIEAHYTANDYWLGENFILDNAKKLSMPIYLMQGRYDMICPPFAAYELHKKLSQSELIWTVAGHSQSDRSTYDLMRIILLQIAGE